MIDSCVFDHFIADDNAARELMAAVDAGRLELVATHVQATENEQTPDLERRARLAAVHRTEIGASVCVLGIWRLGVDRLGDGEIYNQIAKSTRDVKDGVIADTAASEGLPLVTEDGPLRRRAQSLGVEVWSVSEMLIQLRATQ